MLFIIIYVINICRYYKLSLLQKYCKSPPKKWKKIAVDEIGLKINPIKN